MSEQIIRLTDTAANRIKEIMSNAGNGTIGVRVGVKSGGCAGMSYSMEYAKDKKKNDEVIEDKGVKVFIDPAAIIYLIFSIILIFGQFYFG
jgi:iron-sulfur cluster assembly protein